MSSSSTDKPQREPSEVLYRGCLTGGGAITALVCAALTAWAIWLLVSGGFSAATMLLAIFFGLLTLAGALASRAGLQRAGKERSPRRLREGSRQRAVLRLAHKRGGRLTLGELIMHTPLDASEARQILDQFEMHGIADLQMSESGRQVYVFPDIVGEGGDKETARPLLEEDDEVEFLFDELAEFGESEQEARQVAAPTRSPSDDEPTDDSK